MKLSKKLSPAIIEAHKAEDAPYRIWDTIVPQLHLRIQPSGIKSWNVQISRTSTRSLGKWPAVAVEMARTRARAMLVVTEEHGAPPDKIQDTVSDACKEYVLWLEAEGRSVTSTDTNNRFDRTIYSDAIGKIRLSKLTQEDIENWRGRIERGELAILQPKKGRSPNAKPLSKASVNRMRTALVAALNRAVSRRKISPDRALEWNNVKPHKKADGRRDLYLDRQQRQALLSHSDADLHSILACVALTGCRPGDPAEMRRKDYDGRHGTAKFRTKNHERIVPLSQAAIDLFDALANGKQPDDLLFTNSGKKWQHYDWSTRVRKSAEAACLPSGVVMYTLRHCWITDAIVAGMDLLTVARLAGTSLSMIQKHYGHLVSNNARNKLNQVNFL